MAPENHSWSFACLLQGNDTNLLSEILEEILTSIGSVPSHSCMKIFLFSRIPNQHTTPLLRFYLIFRRTKLFVGPNWRNFHEVTKIRADEIFGPTKIWADIVWADKVCNFDRSRRSFLNFSLLGHQCRGDLSMLISIGLYVFNVVCAARLARCRIALVS